MTDNSIRVLLVEDEPAYAEVLRQQLSILKVPGVQLAHASSWREADRSLREDRFDLGVLDLNLPDSEGLQTFRRVREAAPYLPVIVITGMDDTELASHAMRDGAQDYLVKGELGAKLLHRAVRYAIERKRAEEELRHREEFFRVIAENVSDLIAVVDPDGRRRYNSPSYAKLLGDPAALVGTNAFEEVHPADRDRVIEIFNKTLETRVGARTEYRMILKDGSVRFIESQGNLMEWDNGPKVVVVSRDVTERKAASELLREALSDLNKSHEALKATQAQLVHSERLEAVSTFAAGVAHEVKNPLQTIILGVDYLMSRFGADDPTSKMVLTDMGNAVQRADSVIRGLMEFSHQSRRQVQQENLTSILEHALTALESDFMNAHVTLHKEFAEDLPLLEVDYKTLKHVFINLLLHIVRCMSAEGGQIRLRTYARRVQETVMAEGKPVRHFKQGDMSVCALVDARPNMSPDASETTRKARSDAGFGITVLRKIVELYGGVIDVSAKDDNPGNLYRILFKTRPAA